MEISPWIFVLAPIAFVVGVAIGIPIALFFIRCINRWEPK